MAKRVKGTSPDSPAVIKQQTLNLFHPYWLVIGKMPTTTKTEQQRKAIRDPEKVPQNLAPPQAKAYSVVGIAVPRIKMQIPE